MTVIGSDIDTSGMNLTRAQEAHDEEENKAKDFLNKIKDSNQMENVNIAVNIIHNSSVIDGILSFADKNNIDLIVIGSHGRSGFKKLVLGSVASGVITKARCPVLVTKEFT
ncbi:MAG: universal stress protein, partial [Nitrosopumilus sp.]|nr:universal stress protein [Nitrosopumilus sp.]